MKVKRVFLPFTTIWSFKTYREIKKIIKENNIEIVHCHNTFPLISPSVYYASRSLKIPVIQTIHNFRFLCPAGVFYHNGEICEKCKDNKSFKYALKNKCYRNSKLQTAVVVSMLKIHRLLGTYKKISYIFLTEFNKNKFSDLINIKNENIYIKPNFVKKIKSEDNLIQSSNKFVFAGRLEESKGIKFLLRSWKELNKDYKLHIYGDGNLKDYVEDFAKKNSNIEYMGFKSQEEIFKDLSESKALIFSSNLYEGYPMIIAEAFSTGIPVVSSNIGNQKDIIEKSKGGCLFELDNIQSFKESIRNIIINFEEYSNNSKKYYDKCLSEEYNYRLLEGIYEKAKHID